MFNTHSANNPFFWNYYILIVEFIKVITFIVLKWIIYETDYLKSYNNMENMDPKENPGDI